VGGLECVVCVKFGLLAIPSHHIQGTAAAHSIIFFYLAVCLFSVQNAIFQSIGHVTRL